MKENKEYFVCSIGEPDKNYDDENLRRCMLNLGYTLHKNCKQRGAINDIGKNDILLLKYQKHIIGYGKAVGGVDEIQNEDWKYIVRVNNWIIGNTTPIKGIKDAQDGGSNYSAVKKVANEFAIAKMEEIGLLI